MARPLIRFNDTGADVLEAKLRLNLAGAWPQLAPDDVFDETMKAAAQAFQPAHGLAVDGDIGDNTWAALDLLDGGRLISAPDLARVEANREGARMLLNQGDFTTTKVLLDLDYPKPGLPPESRSGIAAGLSWAEQGIGNFERARDLLLEAMVVVSMFDSPLVRRDFAHRFREINLRQPLGPLPSKVNADNLPPSG